MTIGINAAAAFKQPRTGVEEYTYQLIRHLATLEEAKRYQFRLYADGAAPSAANFEIKRLKWPWPMWTQIRLAAEMFLRQPDILFIPVHVLPLIHPKNSVVTIHGLEYEYYPEMYPSKHLRYLRWSTKYALKKARKIIAASENTKKDLIELYGGKPEKIEVIYHGVGLGAAPWGADGAAPAGAAPSAPQGAAPRHHYVLFIGRLEKKKNIEGLIRAFNLLKEKYKIPHKLVLAGPRGYGFRNTKYKIQNTKYKNDIIEKGYVSEKEKWQLLQGAEIFVLPSFYEGFGLPILEAQVIGAPVITSNVSSMPEVAGDGAIFIEPKNIESISEGIYKVISNESLKKELIKKGKENIKRFSWQKCAQETLRVLLESN